MKHKWMDEWMSKNVYLDVNWQLDETALRKGIIYTIYIFIFKIINYL